MNKRILLTVSTLALAFGSAGCLLEPLSPEEEAAWLAETESIDDGDYVPMDGEGSAVEGPAGDPAPDTAEPSTWGEAEVAEALDPTGSYAAGGNEKPDPTPWVESENPDGKPDPTPWRAMSFPQGKPDPVPWVPVRAREDVDPTDLFLVDDGEEKPDPTPWKALR